MQANVCRGIGIIVAVGGVLVAGCDRSSSSKSGENQGDAARLKPFEILIDWQAEPTYLGVYYAKDLGLYQKLGLDVKVVQGRGANQAVATVAAGRYKLATASGGATVLGRNSGMDLVSLGVLYPKISTVVYGLAKTGVWKPTDLVGKKIGIYPGSITKNEFEAFVRANGLDPKSFEVISLNGPDIPLLKAGQVDAVLHYGEMSPALLSIDTELELVNGLRTFELRLAEHGVSSYGLNLVTSRETYLKEGPLLKEIAGAICEAYRKACDAPDPAIAAFVKEFPQMDREYVRASWKQVCGTIAGNYGSQNSEGWAATINLYKSLGLLQVDVAAMDLMP